MNNQKLWICCLIAFLIGYFFLTFVRGNFCEVVEGHPHTQESCDDAAIRLQETCCEDPKNCPSLPGKEYEPGPPRYCSPDCKQQITDIVDNCDKIFPSDLIDELNGLQCLKKNPSDLPGGPVGPGVPGGSGGSDLKYCSNLGAAASLSCCGPDGSKCDAGGRKQGEKGTCDQDCTENMDDFLKDCGHYDFIDNARRLWEDIGCISSVGTGVPGGSGGSGVPVVPVGPGGSDSLRKWEHDNCMEVLNRAECNVPNKHQCKRCAKQKGPGPVGDGNCTEDEIISYCNLYDPNVKMAGTGGEAGGVPGGIQQSQQQSCKVKMDAIQDKCTEIKAPGILSGCNDECKGALTDFLNSPTDCGNDDARDLYRDALHYCNQQQHVNQCNESYNNLNHGCQQCVQGSCLPGGVCSSDSVCGAYFNYFTTSCMNTSVIPSYYDYNPQDTTVDDILEKNRRCNKAKAPVPVPHTDDNYHPTCPVDCDDNHCDHETGICHRGRGHHHDVSPSTGV